MLSNDRKSEIPSTGGRNGFLRKVKSLSLLDKVKNTDICPSLNIKPLLLRIKRLQLRWYDHVTRMFREQTANQQMDALPSGKRPKGRSDLLAEDLAWSRLAILRAALPLVAKYYSSIPEFHRRDAWRYSNLSCCPCHPKKTSGQRKIL